MGGDSYYHNNSLTCANNSLTTLEGAPKEVGGSFFCDILPLPLLKEAFSKYSVVCGFKNVYFKAWTLDKLTRLKNKELSAKEVMGIEDVEQRRVALEHIGYSTFLEEYKAKLISTSYDAELYRIEGVDIEPIHLLKVQDASTPRQYILRTPPDLTDALEAKLWTFQKVWNWYREGERVDFVAET